MSDADIWNLVALVQQLPKMDPEGYKDLVGSSSGHSHAGTPGASAEMSHSEMEADEHADMKQTVPTPTPAGTAGHQHKDGEEH